MIMFPPSKINLGLNVLSKRADGFHEIISCLYEIPVCDVLEILPAESFSFKVTGLQIDGVIEDNLCVRAYRLLQKEFNLPEVFIHLRKEIPMGAGLGGGSADAAHVLLGLNELFDLELTAEQLQNYAAHLGSDCPFFIRGGAQLAKGRGELLEPIDVNLKGNFLKLVNPGIHIGTGEAYSHVTFEPDPSGYDELPDGKLDKLTNSFESYATSKYPEIGGIKQHMINEGAFYAAMSGSGSSVFGLFKNRPEKNTIYDFEIIVEL